MYWTQYKLPYMLHQKAKGRGKIPESRKMQKDGLVCLSYALLNAFTTLERKITKSRKMYEVIQSDYHMLFNL
jgi:hypothetical protein